MSYVKKIQLELDELYDKMNDLGVFIAKGKPNFLDDDEWELLKEQSEHMARYYNVLNIRLSIAKSKEAL